MATVGSIDNKDVATSVDSRKADQTGAVPSWLADTLLVTLVTVIALTFVFQLWNQSLRRPFLYSRDGISQITAVKGVITNGWWHFNPDIGFPFGQRHADFPLGTDNLHYFFIKLLGFLSNDAVLIVNVYFLVSFVLVSLAAFFCLRATRITRWPALAAAILFSFLPYHFLRGTWHLTLAAYWIVPIACLILLKLLQDPAPFFRQVGGRWRGDLGRRSLAFAFGVLLISASNIYYAAFFLVLMVIVAVLRAVAIASLRPIAAAFLLGVLLLGGVAANSVQSLIYQYRHGKNPQVAERSAAESDYYALRPIQMIVPVPGHRVQAFERLTAASLRAPNNSEGSSYLGMLGSVGLFTLLLVTVGAAAGKQYSEELRSLALPVVPAILFGVTGGFSWLFALGGMTEIRSWNRISIFIAFFSLAAIARLLDQLPLRISRLQRTSLLFPALALFLVVFGIADQTSRAIVPDSHRFADEFHQDEDFVGQIERQLRPGDAVFQLPYLPYPEAELDRPPGIMDYDPFRGYLHSKQLRWSYGGMRGREGDWQVTVSRYAPAILLEAVTAVGFRGLWIDRGGYTDHGASLEAEISRSLGQEPLVSRNGRFAFFGLRQFAQEQRTKLGGPGVATLRDDTLALPTVRLGSGFTERHPGIGDPSLSAAPQAELTLTNRTSRSQRVILVGRVRSSDETSGLLNVTTGDQTTRLPLAEAPIELRCEFVLHPGTEPIRFSFQSAEGEPKTWTADSLHIRLAG